MIIENLKMNVANVDEVLNVETLELEVRVLSTILENCKYKYCEEHQLDFDTVIDVTDDGFLKLFFTEYLITACDYRSVYLMIRLTQPDSKGFEENWSHLINSRWECMKIKEAEFPDIQNQEVSNEMLFKQGAFANLLAHAKHNFCRNQSMNEGDMVDVNNWDFLIYLFEEHAEHVNDMGGDLLYDKLDEYLTFMHR